MSMKDEDDTFAQFDKKELVEAVFMQQAVLEALSKLIEAYEEYIDDDEETQRIRLECIRSYCSTSRRMDS